MIAVHDKKLLEKTLDFMHGYLSLKAYFFNQKIRSCECLYPNAEYFNLWRKYFESLNVNSMLKNAFKFIKLANSGVDISCIDLCDTFDRAAHFALISYRHPNITLGFIKDADLWNIWLSEAPFTLVRSIIGDLIGKGEKILDFGCGCNSPLYYGDIIGSNGIYTGVDFSHSMIKIAESKVRAERLDWVNLRKENIETNLAVKRNYDIVISSSVLQYVDNIRTVLKNACEFTNYDGTLFIFSEAFKDTNLDRYNIFKLYYSLIPSFKDFPAVSDILNALDFMGVNYKYKIICKNLMKIDINGK